MQDLQNYPVPKRRRFSSLRGSAVLKAFSLMEVMIAMFVFSLLALGVTAGIINSLRISQNNVLTNTAYTVAQGYLEQIRSVSLEDLQSALDGVASSNASEAHLPCKSISSLLSADLEEWDPLFLIGTVSHAGTDADSHANYPNLAISVDSDGWNYKSIMVDLVDHDDDETTDSIPKTMDMWLDVDIDKMSTSTRTYVVTINFRYALRGFSSQRELTGVLQGAIADINALTL